MGSYSHGEPRKPRQHYPSQNFLADPKNRELFGKFAAKYQPRIKQGCLQHGLQEADADDLAATILLRFCEKDLFDRFVFQDKEKFNRWLNTVVRNDVRTYFRSRRRRPDSWSLGSAEAQQSLERVTEQTLRDLENLCEEDRARIDQARVRVKSEVKDNTWEAFRLVAEEGRKVDEVMAQLGMSQVAVYASVSRVKRRLRQALGHLHDSSNQE